MKTPQRLSEIPRNDVDAAIAYVKAKIERGESITADISQSLLMLQDDPATLVERLRPILLENAPGL